MLPIEARYSSVDGMLAAMFIRKFCLHGLFYYYIASTHPLAAHLNVLNNHVGLE